MGILMCLIAVLPTIAPAATRSDIENNSAVGSEQPTDLPAADQYKRFIENPPPVQDMFVEVRFPERPPSFYHAKWQTNCIFIGYNSSTNMLAAQSATNLLDYYRISSRFGDIYWQKIGADLYSWTNLNLPKQTTNSVTFGLNNAAQLFLYPVMNGGLDLRPAASLRWADDTFSFTNQTFWFKGVLQRDNAGRAESETVSFANLGQAIPEKYHYSYDYYYDAKLSLPYLPSRIEWHATDGEQRNYSRTIVIHSISVAPEPMDVAAFSLDPLLSTTNIHNVVTIATNLLVINPTNQPPGIIRSVVQDPIAAVLVKRPNYRAIYYSIAIIIFLAPVVIYLLFFLRDRKKDR
jgi:hypothetical protein